MSGKTTKDVCLAMNEGKKKMTQNQKRSGDRDMTDLIP